MKSKPPTSVVVGMMAAPKPPAPRPSASTLITMLPPVWALCGPQTCTTAPLGLTERSPKLQLAPVAIACTGPKAPMFAAPSPVTSAPLATMALDWFQTIHSATLPLGSSVATTEGWSMLPPKLARLTQLTPAVVLSMVTMALVPPLMKVA